MENVLDVIARHASVRDYTREKVSEEDLEKILWAARRAPTAWNLMPVTINVVRDDQLKASLAEAVGGQSHVANAPVFLVFSINYQKHMEAARIEGLEPSEPGLGHVMAGLVDAGIMSGWAALAAESLGYGITFIAVYSNPCRIAEILGHPKYVLPAVGLTIGRPAEHPEPRPRQPAEAVIARDAQALEGRGASVLEAYQPGRRTRLFKYVFTEGGYLDRVSERLIECLKKQGFRFP